MELDLEQIKAAALAALSHGESADGEGWFTEIEFTTNMLMVQHDAQFASLVTPAAVFSLVERLEQAERISPYAFWFTAVAEFDDLCPAEVLAGVCLAQRTEAPTPVQRRTLELPPLERCNKIKSYAASTGPDVIF